MSEQACVYIMASGRNGTLYIGATADLPKRVWEHRNGVVPGFTRKYRCTLLVWYEIIGEWEATRQRERQMKKWNRAWKLREIEGLNPDWRDLYDDIALPCGAVPGPPPSRGWVRILESAAGLPPPPLSRISPSLSYIVR